MSKLGELSGHLSRDGWSRRLQDEPTFSHFHALVSSFRIDCERCGQCLAKQLALERCKLSVAAAELTMQCRPRDRRGTLERVKPICEPAVDIYCHRGVADVPDGSLLQRDRMLPERAEEALAEYDALSKQGLLLLIVDRFPPGQEQ